MKMPHTGVEVEGMIFMYDRDKDGLLDYREFLELVTGGTSEHANDFRKSRKSHPAHKNVDDYEYSDEESFHRIGPDGHYVDRTVIHSSMDELSSSSSSSSSGEDEAEFSSDDDIGGLSSMDKKIWYKQKKKSIKKARRREKQRKMKRLKAKEAKLKSLHGRERRFEVDGADIKQLVSSVPPKDRRLQVILHGADFASYGCKRLFRSIRNDYNGKKAVKSKY